MTAHEIGDRLLATANELRPPGSHALAPLVKIANELGVDVSLALHQANEGRHYHARCEFRSAARPRVTIYRASPVSGIADITPAEEHVLSARERFSIAHELGHCVAHLSFGVDPASPTGERREYWRQERAMNQFACALLVPPWLSAKWRSQLSTVDAACVFRIRSWASECRVSPEVVVTALTRDTPGLGFLKLAEAMRRPVGKRVLVVFHSAASAGVTLPNVFSHIDDPAFVSTVSGSKGVVLSRRTCLGSIELKDVQWAWSGAKSRIQSRRKEFKRSVRLSGLVYWVCAFTAARIDQGQGTLRFDPE